MSRSVLDAALRAAHAAGDPVALARLYAQAADAAEARRDPDATCFYLTHAFVFALEAGVPEAQTLNQRLVARGRARPLAF